MSRYNFRQRSQQAGESVIQFVAALRELSALCNFGGLCEEMIRDKLIEKTSVNRIRERRAIQLALQVEMTMMLARSLQPSQVQHVSLKPLPETETGNTLPLWQLSHLQRVVTALRENGEQIVVLFLFPDNIRTEQRCREAVWRPKMNTHVEQLVLECEAYV